MKKIILILFVSFLIGIGLAALEEKKEAVPEKEIHAENKIKPEEDIIKKKVDPIKVPLIMQQPELDRGCEVTSLAMLLQHAGVDVGKMQLAEEIKKDKTPYKREGNVFNYGNPNDGFVGDIYTFDNMGYGVYHEPVAELAENYLPGQIKDLSGKSFEDAVLKPLSRDKPVWVIINAKYQKLPASEFRTWNTPSGKVKITWQEHSVVVTGYDEEFIYFNDPLGKNQKAPREGFKAAWQQMGSQAITYN